MDNKVHFDKRINYTQSFNHFWKDSFEKFIIQLNDKTNFNLIYLNALSQIPSSNP